MDNRVTTQDVPQYAPLSSNISVYKWKFRLSLFTPDIITTRTHLSTALLGCGGEARRSHSPFTFLLKRNMKKSTKVIPERKVSAFCPFNLVYHTTSFAVTTKQRTSAFLSLAKEGVRIICAMDTVGNRILCMITGAHQRPTIQ